LFGVILLFFAGRSFDRHVGDSLNADPEMCDTFWRILSDNMDAHKNK